MSTFTKNTKIVLFGDSLTEQSYDVDRGCWASMLANHFQRISDVVTRGFSGYNTTHLKIILPQILDDVVSKEVSVFVLLMGANDCNRDIQQFVDLPKFSENYREIINILKKSGIDSSKLLMITPPPYDHTKYIEYCRETGRNIPSRSIEYVKTYVNEVVNIAQCEKLKCINIFEKMCAEKNCSNLLSDGLHFSKEGAKFVFETVLPEISERILSHRGTLDKRFVDWKEIDHKCPESSLKQ